MNFQKYWKNMYYLAREMGPIWAAICPKENTVYFSHIVTEPAWDKLQCCHTGALLLQPYGKSTPTGHIISWHGADQPYFPALALWCWA